MAVPLCTKQTAETYVPRVGVEDLECPTRSPDLNLAEHRWNELECILRARPPCLTSVHDINNALVAERHHSHAPKIEWKAFPRRVVVITIAKEE